MIIYIGCASNEWPNLSKIIDGRFFIIASQYSRYDKVSANVMISVQKMGESESGQIVF